MTEEICKQCEFYQRWQNGYMDRYVLIQLCSQCEILDDYGKDND